MLSLISCRSTSSSKGWVLCTTARAWCDSVVTVLKAVALKFQESAVISTKRLSALKVSLTLFKILAAFSSKVRRREKVRRWKTPSA